MNAARMLRQARRRAGLSQRALAAAAGVPQSTVARAELGKLDPRFSTLNRILQACGEELRPGKTYGAGVDRGLIRAMLRLSPADRIRAMASASADLQAIRGKARR